MPSNVIPHKGHKDHKEESQTGLPFVIFVLFVVENNDYSGGLVAGRRETGALSPSCA
jgi:hypothetical protein